MCGIAFIARTDGTNLGPRGIKAATSLLMSNQLRGVDSVGLCWLKGLEAQTYKIAESAAEARLHHSSAYNDVKSPFLLMHTRAATIGSVTDETAHPFTHPESGLIGVHNGTISEFRQLWPAHAKEALSDSWALYRELGDNTPEDAPGIISAIHSGAFAMIWYDPRIQAVRFVRNTQRPLWLWQGMIGHAEEHLIIASRPEYIAQAVAHAHPTDPLAYMNVMPYEVRTNALVTIPLHLNTDDEDDRKEPYITEFEADPKPQPPAITTKFSSAHDYWDADGCADSYDNSYPYPDPWNKLPY